MRFIAWGLRVLGRQDMSIMEAGALFVIAVPVFHTLWEKGDWIALGLWVVLVGIAMVLVEELSKLFCRIADRLDRP